MVIGIDASRAFQKNKTGIEEYSYQVIKHLTDYLSGQDVVLYLNPAINDRPDFEIPDKWRTRFLRAPIFWTQIRLSFEMLFRPVDILFVPAHTVPLIHPKKTIVTVHGLEYEFCPGAYSLFGRTYMRFSIKNSCKWAENIIAVSKNTKKDLVKLYKVPTDKIEVIYEGYERNSRHSESDIQKAAEHQTSVPDDTESFVGGPNAKYFLFVGRLEERKNIRGIIKAFEILKEKYNVSHKLILAGKFGYGRESIEQKISESIHKGDIILPGYVSDEKKSELLEKADAFLFPTFYEGFGLPILEAQSVGVPVITSNLSSMPEVAGDGAILVDPQDSNAIAEEAQGLISDVSRRNGIIQKGLENVKRFSWQKCAKEIANLMQTDE